MSALEAREPLINCLCISHLRETPLFPLPLFLNALPPLWPIVLPLGNATQHLVVGLVAAPLGPQQEAALGIINPSLFLVPRVPCFWRGPIV